MKKYGIFLCCIFGLAHGMDTQKPKAYTPCEWDAHDYAKGNRVQQEAFLHFLTKNNIAIENKRILDIGCGTGNISAILAQKAEFVDGVDQSANMIRFANDHYYKPYKLLFHQGFAENFSRESRYNLAVASFVFQWFEDKPEALENIAHNLEQGGEFFFTAHTSDNPKPLSLVVTEEFMSSNVGWFLSAAKNFFSTDQSKAIGTSYPTKQELIAMIHHAGFEIMRCEEQSFDIILQNRAEVEDFQRPIVMSRPITQYLPDMMKTIVFSQFIDRLLPHMKKTDDGKFIEEIRTTIVHVRKK